MMSQLGNMDGMKEGMAKAMEALMGGAGADGEGLASLLGGLGADGEGGSGEDLKQRVNDLAARLMQQRGGEVDPMAELSPEIDDEF